MFSSKVLTELNNLTTCKESSQNFPLPCQYLTYNTTFFILKKEGRKCISQVYKDKGNLLQYKLKIKSVNNGIVTKSSHSICRWPWLPKGGTKF